MYHLLKKAESFISMKGAAAEDELADAEKALTVLGANIKEEHSFKLPVENSERNIFIFDKKKSTPKNIHENQVFQIRHQFNNMFHVEQLIKRVSIDYAELFEIGSSFEKVVPGMKSPFSRFFGSGEKEVED